MEIRQNILHNAVQFIQASMCHGLNPLFVVLCTYIYIYIYITSVYILHRDSIISFHAATLRTYSVSLLLYQYETISPYHVTNTNTTSPLLIFLSWSVMAWEFFPHYASKFGMKIISVWYILDKIPSEYLITALADWGLMTHICVNNFAIIGSDNGWSASSHYLKQYRNIVNSKTLEKKMSEILSEIHICYFMKRHLQMSSARCRKLCR